MIGLIYESWATYRKQKFEDVAKSLLISPLTKFMMVFLKDLV